MSGCRFHFHRKADKANRNRSFRIGRHEEERSAEVHKTLQKWKIEARLPVVREHLEKQHSVNIQSYRELDQERFAIHMARKPTPELKAAFNDSFRKTVKQARAGLADNETDVGVHSLARIIADYECSPGIRLKAMETMISALAYEGNQVMDVFYKMGLVIGDSYWLQSAADEMRNNSFLRRLIKRTKRTLRLKSAFVLERLDQVFPYNNL